jgi:hypothetical protein
MAKNPAQVGHGRCVAFGQLTDCPVVESRDPAGQSEVPRAGFSRKAYVTFATQQAAKHNGLAGGDLGTWDNPQPDVLPGTENT